ncbi:Ankyrin repeat-containing domain [Fusarium acutatum]|uniref:Ankyrin repeat-containing domain n=1 Tax=Fusarium acutatum TaxID=78861 RepID=A0A8H4NJC6_9HYPO|nr:Ankyrin repeat-containing domain [Fusarium acutatum]
MADPLSVAGLALAVVSLGLQVTGGITDYFDALKSRDQDIASIIQRNDTLRKTLQIIESSISRFQNDHRTTTEALRQFLDSSKEELKVLDSMVATLITDDQGTTGRKYKARNKGKKLLYPFHRPKLEQMATKLHHINATLQLGLQSLGLSVSHLGSEKLATLQATSQTISSNLLVVQSEVSAISTPIQGIQSTMSQFETRFNGLENLLGQLLVQGSTIKGTLQEITPALVTGRLLRKPAQKAAWGSLRFSYETTIEQHAPGCTATEAISEIDKSNKFALTYIGLRYFLNSAIQLSFSIRSGAGGWSLGPNFTYYPMVDSRSAPAFRMLNLLMGSWFGLSPSPGLNGLLDSTPWRANLLPSVVSSILNLFRAKKASPRAVDDYNKSLVHYVADSIRLIYGHDRLQTGRLSAV